MAAQAQPIPISKLSPQQLSSLHQSLQIELRNNEQQLEALYQVQDQYMNNKAIVQNLGTPKVQGKPMLVPLNASMYVTGEIESYERVIIDVGANYFISKKLPAAVDFYDRKIKMIEEQINKVNKLITDRKTMITAVQEQIAKIINEAPEK